MAQKRKRFLSSKVIIISLILLGGLAYSLYRVVPSMLQSNGIFLVTEPLEYGELTVAGTLYKDTPVGENGNYYLATNTGRYFMLDITDADALLGLPVTLTGFLTPPVDPTLLPAMTVSELRSN